MNAPSGISEVSRVYEWGPGSSVVSRVRGRSTYAQTMATSDKVPDDDRLAVSATLYVTFRRCPQQALARLRGIYPAPSRASFKGALAHRLFARHLAGDPIDPGDLEAVCRQETGANLNGQLAAVGLKPSQFRGVVAEVGELYRRFAALPVDAPAGTEVPIDVEIGDGVALRGRIDAVFDEVGGPRIVDWKTGPTLGDDVDAQLGFYAYAWSREHGVPPATLDAVSVATGERRRATPSEGDLERTERNISAMVDALRRALDDGGDLERTAGPHCRWCPLLTDCAEGSTAVALLD